MSPLTRRIVAVGLLVFVLLLLLRYIVVPITVAIGEQRAELAALRGRDAHLQSALRRAPTPSSQIPSGWVIAAPNAVMASQQLLALLVGTASMTGVVIQTRPTCPPTPETPFACIDLSVTGKEADIMRFISRLEHGDPKIRFHPWQLAQPGQENAPLVFSGRAIAAIRIVS